MKGETSDGEPAGLELRLLGPLEVRRGGERVALPRSKKARALLAYLAMTGREHNRQRLCSLLWDVTDDPRGALRWSLSKLRRVVDDDEARIAGDRHVVRFEARGARIDARELLSATRDDLGKLSTEQLQALVAPGQGELLEGFELPDFLEFQAWLQGAREQTREARSAVLAELTARLQSDPRAALPHARARVQADPLSIEARETLLSLLIKAGRRAEASQQLEVGCRLFREIGAPGVAELQAAYRVLCTAPTSDVQPQPSEEPPAAAPAPATPEPQRPQTPDGLIGRDAELQRLGALFEAAVGEGAQRVALVGGDPGAGKSRLAEALIARARTAGAAVLRGRAHEAESSRPYGPWTDAVGSGALDSQSSDGPTSREALFDSIANAIAESTRQAAGALLVLDDIQWLDRDSAELLHFVVRTTRQLPLCILLLARSGELSDNEPARRAVRGLRREAALDEIQLRPLGADDVAALIGEAAKVDAAQIFEASGGNPLYALELARARALGVRDAPDSLVALVRERIERLPAQAAEILRWGAVLGHTVEVSRLQLVSSVQAGELLDALEQLERHAMLQGAAGDEGGVRYTFAHDVMRAAVYSDLSHPRRRLMHQQVARALSPRAADPSIATEVAHHASLAGDASLGVQACVVAARRSVRLFANADAEALVRRGLSLAENLGEAERVTATLELLQVQYAARAPDRQQAAERVLELAERALDLGLARTARLGFQMLSYLRWESSRMVDAHEHIMRAERISRSADPAERSVALAQAAKCLVLLERDLEQAEAFTLEACSLEERQGASSSAVTFARGMLHEHRGECGRARACFQEARELGREAGDRLAEFGALEHLLMLELDVGDAETALRLAEQLAELGQRVRAGAEGPSSRALLALSQRFCGHDSAEQGLRDAIEELVVEDAKYELAFVLTRLAAFHLERGEREAATEHAERGLSLATALGRASEIAHAHAVLTGCDPADAEQHRQALRQLQGSELSCGARRQLEAALGV